MAPSATDPSPNTGNNPQPYADPDALRTAFTAAMSAMYKAEVPLYGDLIRIVSAVNTTTRTGDLDPRVLAMRHGNVASSRLDIERHGAIRLGTPHELRTVRRIFAIIGLYPVGYYNLSAAGLPMHATCFRPRSASSLKQNPFRVFTSVLRPELIHDDQARALALKLLSKRNIFTAELMSLLDLADKQGGRLTVDQGTSLVMQAMESFRWHGTAASSHEDYQLLKREHPILADVACFRSAHINHLTPRTLDITAAQEEMKADGLKVKDRIEGPPERSCPILLRQTSFLAIEEPIQFITSALGTESRSSFVRGSHRARFGEIEERGAAVTLAGRQLYDELLQEAMTASSSKRTTPEELDRQVELAFRKYPDDWTTLRARKLVYFTYQATDKSLPDANESSFRLEDLIQQGTVNATPITYEDFLPLSAAGIFRSNLGTQASSQSVEALSDEIGMEKALGVKLYDSDELYKSMQRESIETCEAQLGIKITI